jgi:hypothetical protein
MPKNHHDPVGKVRNLCFATHSSLALSRPNLFASIRVIRGQLDQTNL